MCCHELKWARVDDVPRVGDLSLKVYLRENIYLYRSHYYVLVHITLAHEVPCGVR
jgi:hypothetical protein